LYNHFIVYTNVFLFFFTLLGSRLQLLSDFLFITEFVSYQMYGEKQATLVQMTVLHN